MYTETLTSTESNPITALVAMCADNESSVVSEHKIESPDQMDARMPTTKNKDFKSDADYLNGLLMKVAVSQDKEAFKELFKHFAPRIKGFFQGQGSSADKADEVVQEAMVNVWRKSHLFDPTKAKASTWIFTVARNARIDLLRKENRPEPDFTDPSFFTDSEPQPDEIYERDDEAQRLQVVLAQLPEEQSKVLRLAFFEQKAHAEIAEELDLPLGTVKSRIRLAFKRLRKELGENI